MNPLWMLCVILDHYHPVEAQCFPPVATPGACTQESERWHEVAIEWAIRSHMDPKGPMSMCGPAKGQKT